MSEAATKLLKIQDLAARWDLPLRRAKERVKLLEVPFINLGESKVKIAWKYARFRVEDIERFEAGQTGTIQAEQPAESARRNAAASARRRSGPSTLWGNSRRD